MSILPESYKSYCEINLTILLQINKHVSLIGQHNTENNEQTQDNDGKTTDRARRACLGGGTRTDNSNLVYSDG